LKTIGYGDIPLQHVATKIFLIIYVLISTISLAVAFENFLSFQQIKWQQKTKHNIITNKLSLETIITSFDPDDEREELEARTADVDSVSKYHFVLSVLHYVGAIRKETDIDPWIQKFKELDTAGTGYLSRKQLKNVMAFDEEESPAIETKDSSI